MFDPLPALRIVALAVGAYIAAAWLFGAVYIVVTYIEAVRYVPKRSLRHTLRSAFREAWYVAWTQPLLPLFQFALKRMGNGGGETPVIMVHGYFQNRVDFIYLATRLRAAGCGQLYAANFFWPQRLEASAEYIRSFVERVRSETGAERVNLLTHSSGGLLALDVLEAHPEWIDRVAVIAVPQKGVTWKGPVVGRAGSQLRADSEYAKERSREIAAGQVLSVYSAHDNLVHPPRTSRLSGPDVRNMELQNLGHLSVAFDHTVGDAVCDFLVPPNANEEGDRSPSSHV